MNATPHGVPASARDAAAVRATAVNGGCDDCLDVIVIGAGQAGLSLAWHLAQQGRRFLLVDAAPAVGHVWRSRWDSLRLFSPAQYDSLPGMDFPARADTYPTKDQVADYLAEYAARFELPILLGTAVTRLEQRADRFAVHTSQGTLRSWQVVVATGPFQRPLIPTVADDLGPSVRQLHSAEYRNPGQVPPGPVVVVGAGNSGLQIADELTDDHHVTLAVGTRPLELPQRVLGRDLFWWLSTFGLITKTADSLLAKRMQARGDLIIGSSIKALRRRGVTIRPRVVSTSAEAVTFADGTSVQPTTVVWATGFGSDYSWIEVPGIITEEGQVVHRRGVTDAPGLYFLGLPWQHTRGSALLGFVRHDAAWLAGQIEHRRAVAGVEQPQPSGPRCDVRPGCASNDGRSAPAVAE
jgi:putative flavoprotein involved in K+ transport